MQNPGSHFSDPNLNDTAQANSKQSLLKIILSHRSTAFFFIAAVIIFVCGFILIKTLPLLSDEVPHYEQITEIVETGKLIPNICTNLPGYHWSMVLLSRLIHSQSITTMRCLSSGLSFLCLAIFFLLARIIDRDSAVQKSTLFLFFPAFFPFFFMIYTDLYSMLYLFLAVLCALEKRPWLSGICGILSILVRQNNIIWVAFVGTLIYFENYYPQYRWKDVKLWMPKFLFFFLALILLIAFAVWNKGFVIGQRASHPMSLSFGNFFFALFLFFFLFLPYNLSNARKIFQFLKQYKFAGLILIQLFLIYLLFFKVNHPYNRFGRILHNWILWMMDASFLNKALTFLPIAYSVLSLCVTRFHRKSFYLIYPFSILFLMVLPVIEVRYCFISYALFLLFKEKDPEEIIDRTLAIYFVVIGCLLYLMFNGPFLL